MNLSKTLYFSGDPEKCKGLATKLGIDDKDYRFVEASNHELIYGMDKGTCTLVWYGPPSHMLPYTNPGLITRLTDFGFDIIWLS